MTTQTKMYDLSEMLNLYETTVQGTFQIHGTRKDALRLARQAIQQKYPEIKTTNIGSNILIARFWKKTQSIIRKYYPSTLPLQPTSNVGAHGVRPDTNASDVRAHSVVPNAMRPDAVPNSPRYSGPQSFEHVFLSWIAKNDYIPTDQFLLTFLPGLDQDTITKAAAAAMKLGYRFQQGNTGFLVTKRPAPINSEVAEIKSQVAALISRLDKLTGNSNLFR